MLGLPAGFPGRLLLTGRGGGEHCLFGGAQNKTTGFCAHTALSQYPWWFQPPVFEALKDNLLLLLLLLRFTPNRHIS